MADKKKPNPKPKPQTVKPLSGGTGGGDPDGGKRKR